MAEKIVAVFGRMGPQATTIKARSISQARVPINVIMMLPELDKRYHDYLVKIGGINFHEFTPEEAKVWVDFIAPHRISRKS